MADIVLYDRTGEPVTYEGIETITTDTPDAEKGATFTYGVAVENAEYKPNFAEGNQKVTLEKGQLLKEFTLVKPETLLPEYIKKNVEVAGVLGEFAGDETEKTVDLAMADGNQVIEADADTVMTKVTVTKPETMSPENIKKDVEIGGITGTFIGDGQEKTVLLSMADGDQVIEADKNTVLAKITVLKPDTLVPANIMKDVEIGGVVGTFEGSGRNQERYFDEEWLEKICFWDIDGTLLYSFTISEANELETLPTPPEHEGLTFQEWNYTLEEIKSAEHILDIGPIYIPTDGKTHVFINITESKYMAFPVYFKQTVANGVTIDWGDGSTSTSSSTGDITFTHTYSAIGEYEITFAVADGCVMTLGQGTYATSFLGKNSSTYCNYVTKIYLGNNVDIGAYGLYTHSYLEVLTIPNTITSILDHSIGAYQRLKALIIPKSIASVAGYGFYNLNISQNFVEKFVISIPNGLAEFGDGMFSMYKAKRIVIPDTIKAMGSYCFQNIYSTKKIYFSKVLESYGSSSFTNAYLLREQIKIPETLEGFPYSVINHHRTMEDLIISEGVTTLGGSNVSYCYMLKRVVLPSTLKSIGTNFLSYCHSMKTLIIKSALETCGTTGFSNVIIEDYVFTSVTVPTAFPPFNYYCKIYVPDEVIDAYKSAISSAYTSCIYPLSEYKGEIP